MQAQKRCVQCNTFNDANANYCVRCKKYLGGKAARAERPLTIWETGDYLHQSTDPAGAVLVSYVAICPYCKGKTPAEDGTLPWMCKDCGYLFQDGIDQVTTEGAAVGSVVSDSTITSAPPPVDPIKDPPSVKKNPLPKRENDQSGLRFISIVSGIVSEPMMNSGNILGAEGNVLRMIQTDVHIRVWHTPTGWYISPDKGTYLLNGNPQAQGSQRKLSDGDMFPLGKEYLRAQIELPMQTQAADSSSLRFSGGVGIPTEKARAEGGIIGVEATMLRNLHSDQQLRVWHCDDGWRICADRGRPIRNGVPMNQGVSSLLTDGDQLMIGNELITAEIYG